MPFKSRLAVTVTEKQKRDAGRIVRKGAEVLADRKWIRGAVQNVDKDGFCMIGAMSLAVCGNAQPKNLYDLDHPVSIASLLFRQWYNEHIDNSKAPFIPGYNDGIAESKEAAIAMMHKFADYFDPQK